MIVLVSELFDREQKTASLLSISLSAGCGVPNEYPGLIEHECASREQYGMLQSNSRKTAELEVQKRERL